MKKNFYSRKEDLKGRAALAAIILGIALIVSLLSGCSEESDPKPIDLPGKWEFDFTIDGNKLTGEFTISANHETNSVIVNGDDTWQGYDLEMMNDSRIEQLTLI